MTVASFLDDLFKKYPSLKYKDLFMTLNWLKTYSVSHVMAAIWGPCEEYINPVLEDYIAKFASLKEGKIRLDRFNDETIIVFSIDACHFMTDEMALTPSSRWYDHKKGGAGVKCVPRDCYRCIDASLELRKKLHRAYESFSSG